MLNLYFRKRKRISYAVSVIFVKILIMDALTVFFIISMVVFIIGSFFILFRSKKNKEPQVEASSLSKQLQLQAYERLTLLIDRIALPNLISRLNQPELSAKEMQLLLIHSIKQEFDYNITQQIYVSAAAWNAVKNLKDQTMLVINQFGSTLPNEASGADLNKLLLEYLMNDKRGNHHELVSEAISFEARKLL